jgi:hypothetical protein
MTDEIREARFALEVLRGVEHTDDPGSPLDTARENAHLRALRAKARKVVDSHDRASRAALLRQHHARASHRGRRGYVSPAVELQRANWICIAAIVAAQLLAPKVQPVGSGIDTLELHTKLPVGPYFGQRLEAAFDLAQRTGQPQLVVVADTEFHLRPRLVKGGWLLSNVASDVVLRVRADAEPDEAAVVVELHAAALWALGWRAAGDLAEKLCQSLTGESDVDLQVTRLDLCVDFQGWQPTADDRDLFTTRAKRVGKYREGHLAPEWESAEWIATEAARAVRIGKQLARAESPDEQRRLLEALLQPTDDRATMVEYDAGRMAFTGFAFGRGSCLGARLYNKSREIRVSRKGWFHAVWAQSENYRAPPGGAVNGQVRAHFDVWRLEFQVRREALRQFTIDVGGGRWRDLSAWSDCREHLDHLWQTLSAKWLRHGYRTKDDRQAMSRPWRALHFARISEGGAVTQLARHIPEVAVQPTLGSVAGYLTTAAAQLLEAEAAQLEALSSPAGVEWERAQGRQGPTDFGAVMTSVLASAFEYAEAKRNATAQQLAEEKADAIRSRRAFLARRDTSRDEARRKKAASAQRHGTWNGIGVLVDEEHDHRDELVKRRRMEAFNALSRAAGPAPF